ncbi:MAG: LytTR family two component transcriptional regulator [Bacteroidetes bacterium]|nr:MAG: LytTR family two component transcriptional regulator [Bacteroidota bacterium]
MGEITRCIAVDDEAPALRVLEQYASARPDLLLEAKFRNPLEARDWLRTHPTEILFLDIRMPQETGMEMLQQLEKKPAVIFTTAFADYAADAFDLAAVDYLRKPFSFERFCIAVDKAKDFLLVASGRHAVQEEQDVLMIKTGNGVMKIRFSEIHYIEAYQEYIKIFTDGGRFVTYERMKNMETMLPAARFMRVHRSYIVALARVKTLHGYVAEVEGVSIPVSRDMKEKLMNAVFRKGNS